MAKFNAYLIETLANLHAGSGDIHFGFVDNLIQRNPFTSVPVIHSSGVKGALREHFEYLVKTNRDQSKKNLTLENIENLFGEEYKGDTPENSAQVEESIANNPADSKKSAKGEKRSFAPGHLIFMEANMVTIPLRATSYVYYNCTSPSVLIDYITQLGEFVFGNSEFTGVIDELAKISAGMNNDFCILKDSLQSNEKPENLEIEDFTGAGVMELSKRSQDIIKAVCKLDDLKNFALFKDEIFQAICSDSIPVIARNKIKENGTSENLFYEEVLPRKTRLSFIIGNDGLADPVGLKVFGEILNTEIFQFGGNYTVGYGFSKIHEITIPVEVKNESEKH